MDGDSTPKLRYKTTIGSLDESYDPDAESKIPKTADDLTLQSMPLKLRESSLEKLRAVFCKLKSLELHYIMKSSSNEDSKTKPLDRQKNPHNELELIRTRLGYTSMLVKCETKTCASKNPDIPVYENLCATCTQYADPKLDSVGYDLMTLRNLISKVTYLQTLISMSLANQLDEAQLSMSITETDILAKAIL
jgi:hypothetical protein